MYRHSDTVVSSNGGVYRCIAKYDLTEYRSEEEPTHPEGDRTYPDGITWRLIQKDAAYDQLKLQIATLYVKITNNLSALKTAGENAAIYQGASALNERQFQHGNFEIEQFAYTGLRGQGAVDTYQGLLTQITIDIITLEILTHTPIITNTTTEITLDEGVDKSQKEIERENKAVEKRIKQAYKDEMKREKEEEEEAEKMQKEAEKEAKKAQKDKK